MRRAIVLLFAALSLSACLSLDGAYDEHARNECDRETTASQRGACYDRVDAQRRDRNR